MRFAAAVGRGGVKTPPYGAKDTWAVMAKSRARPARPQHTTPKWGADERGKGGRQPFPDKDSTIRNEVQ